MIIKHQGKEPKIDPTAYVAPNACICGDVKIGRNTRIMHGAQLIAEGAPIEIGDYCIVLENAVIRGCHELPVSIGHNCLVGPNAHLAGCTIEDEVFLATGVSVFHGARICKGSEVRINAVVHLKTEVPANTTVPIGWVAVGKPMGLFPADEHDDIWNMQKPLNFPKLVYGIERDEGVNKMEAVCGVMSKRLGRHAADQLV